MTNKPLILGVVTAFAVAGGQANAATDPYVVTIQQVGPNVVATSNAGGEFDTAGLTNTSGNFGLITRAQIAPGVGQFTFGSVSGLPGSPDQPTSDSAASRAQPPPPPRPAAADL